MFVDVQTKRVDVGENGPFIDDYYEFKGNEFTTSIVDIADVCSYTMHELKRYTLHGMPYKYMRHVFFSEVRDWKPPNLNKLGVEYAPSPYALSSGKSFLLLSHSLVVGQICIIFQVKSFLSMNILLRKENQLM